MQTITFGRFIRRLRQSFLSPFCTCSQQSHSGQNSCPPAKCWPGSSRITRIWSETSFSSFSSSTCSRPSLPWWSAHTWISTTASRSSGASVFSSTESLHSGKNLMILLNLLFLLMMLLFVVGVSVVKSWLLKLLLLMLTVMAMAMLLLLMKTCSCYLLSVDVGNVAVVYDVASNTYLRKIGIPKQC